MTTVRKSAWRRLTEASSFAGVLVVGACHTAHHNLAPTEMIVSPTACADFTVSVYFERGSTHLNREADALLSEASRRAQDCLVTGIAITGLADMPGTPQVNQALSKARTLTVTRVLIRHGFMGFEFKSVDTSAGAPPPDAASPFRRRADVQFHLAPRRP